MNRTEHILNAIRDELRKRPADDPTRRMFLREEPTEARQGFDIELKRGEGFTVRYEG